MIQIISLGELCLLGLKEARMDKVTWANFVQALFDFLALVSCKRFARALKVGHELKSQCCNHPHA